MEIYSRTQYQKIINLWDNKTNQLFKFKTKNGVELTDDGSIW